MSENKFDTIIVAEDSAPNRLILVHLLKKFGFRVIECTDGQVALEELHKSTPDQPVRAIISDIMMPRLDGIEFLKNVREDARYADLPFILVTSVSDRHLIVKAKELNVTSYILKPVTADRVKGKLQEIFPDRNFALVG